MADFNPFNDAGAVKLPASSAPPQPAADSFDPFTQGGATKLSTPDSFDPFASGKAQLTDPQQIKTRFQSDPSYVPSNDEFRTWHDWEKARPVSDVLKEQAGDVWKGIKGVVSLPSQVNQEMSQEADKGSPGEFVKRLAASVPEVAGQLTRMVTDPILGDVSDIVNSVKNGNVFEKPGTTQADRDEEMFQDWKQQKLFSQAKKSLPSSADWSRGGVEPFPATASVASFAVPVGELGGLHYLKGAKPAVAGKTLVESALEKGGESGGQTATEKLVGGTGAVAQKIGGTARTAGKLPEKVLEKAAALLVGEDAAPAMARTMEGAGLFHPVTAHVAAPALALETSGAALEKAGQAASEIAKTPAAGPFGRLVNLAKNTDAPEWLRHVAGMPIVQSLYKVGQPLATTAKGAAAGAVIGATLNAANGESPGEGAGAGLVLGGGFGAANARSVGKAKLFNQRAAGVMDLVGKNLQAGVTPETLARVPDAAMLAAADIPYLGIKDAQGRDLDVRFSDEKTSPELAGQDGFYDPVQHQIVLNADNMAKSPAAWSSIFHEVLHPLMESAVANRPELKAQIDQALKNSGKTLDQGKYTYAYRHLQSQLKAQGIGDPLAVDTWIKDWIAKRDAASAAGNNGDPNHWFYSEILADAGRDALGNVQDVLSPEGAINRAVKPAVSQILQDALGKLGVNFKKTKLGKTVIPGFENVVADPSLRKSVFNLLKSQRDFIPGISKTAEQGVKLTPADMGTAKAPFYVLPNGQKGNKYSEVVPDGKGGEKTVMRNPSQVVRAEKTEAKAISKYIKPGEHVGKLPPEFYTDPNIGEWTKQAAKAAEDAAGNGTALESWYHGIGKSGEADWKKSVRATLGNVFASRQKFFVMPSGLHVSKAGNPLMDVFSIAGFDRKAQLWMNRKEGPLSLERWGGDINKFLADVNTYNQNHAQGLPGDSNNLGAEKRNIINAFLFGRNAKFAEANPLRKQLRGAEDRQGIVRSLRLDRLETLEPGETGLTRPDYEKGTKNFSPEQDAPARLQELTQKQDRTPEEDQELNRLTWRSARNNSREAFDQLAQSTADQAAQERAFSPESEAYPDKKWIIRQLRTNVESRVGFPVLKAFVIGSEARGVASPGSDLDIGLVIPKSEKISALQRSEAYHQKFTNDRFKPKWNGRTVDFQFFYPDAPELKDYSKINLFSPASKFIDNKEPDVNNRGVKALPNTVGDKQISLVHLSSQSELKKVDPKFFGQGRANRNDRSGGNKSYFFVAGSPLKQDVNVFGNGGYYAYSGEVSGSKIYDLRTGKADPLNYFSTLNREEADENLRKAGYDGVMVGANDGRQVVMMFKPVAVKSAGEFKGSKIPKQISARKRQYSPEAEVTQGRKEPNETVRKVAEEYTKAAGLPYTAHTGNTPVNEAFAKQVADFYQTAEHNPDDPAVKAAYDAFAKETLDQWNYITSQGVKMEPWFKDGQPYKNSADMMKDVRENDHLWFFPTEGGFGSTEGPASHPLLEKSGIKVDGRDLPINDLFRAVHDYFGHAKEGYEFGPRGEYNAFLSHVRMYSEAARPAMAAETLGQNSWVNYGSYLRDAQGAIPKKGEDGFIPLADRPFAEQKATMLPPEMVDQATKQFSPATKAGQELEKKGFTLNLENYGTGVWSFTVQDKEGKQVGMLTASSQAPGEASIDNVVIGVTNQRKGIGEALYHELGAQLQHAGITEVTGTAVHPGIPGLREKVFGNVSRLERGKVLSTIEPDQQFSPAQEKENAPVFYSQLEKVVGTKFSGKEMPAAQLAAIIRNPQSGIKADELKWSGLDDFLKGKSRVTKEEVQQYLKDNQMQVKEVVKGGDNVQASINHESKYAIPEVTRLAGEHHGAVDDALLISLENDGNAYRALIKKFPELREKEDWAETVAKDVFGSFNNVRGAVKYSDRQLPGGENYREIVFQLPSRRSDVTFDQYLEQYKNRFPLSKRSLEEIQRDYEAGHVVPKLDALKSEPVGFKSPHWEEPNVLAHTRINDRVDSAGKPGLFTEEIQSDWHQQGRKFGYRGQTKPVPAYAQFMHGEGWIIYDAEGKRIMSIGLGQDATEARVLDTAKAKLEAGAVTPYVAENSVSDAPLKNSWHEFVFRRLVRMAAEEGKDWLGWTTGEQQAERYDLSKQVSRIELQKGRYEGEDYLAAYDHNNRRVVDKMVKPEEIEDYIGKEMAKKFSEMPWKKYNHEHNDGTTITQDHKVLSGLDLKVGGEGMKGFYDKILVDYANKFGKKFGAKVEERVIPDGVVEKNSMGDWTIHRPGKEPAIVGAGYGKTPAEVLSKWYEGDTKAFPKVHSLPITPEMKSSVLTDGVALFSPTSKDWEDAHDNKSVGLIGTIKNDEVSSKRSKLNNGGHAALGFRGDNNWRYSPVTKTVYFWEPPTDEQKMLVKDHIEGRGSKVSAVKQIDFTGSKTFDEAHGSKQRDRLLVDGTGDEWFVRDAATFSAVHPSFKTEKEALDFKKNFSPEPQSTPQIDDKLSARFAKRIASLTQADGGTTFNVANGQSVKQGKVFGVSIYPDRSVILEPKDLTPERVQQFIKDNSDLLSNPENTVGTWLDKASGKVYLDVSVGFKDRKLAEYAGWKYNQKAIWDSEKGAEIPTGGSGDPLEHMAPAGERINLLRKEFELQHPKTGEQQLPGMGRIVLDPASQEVKNVRDLESVRPDRTLTPTERAASDEALQTLRQRVQLLPSVEDRVRVRRAVRQGILEVADYLEKQTHTSSFNSGKDWYRNDITKAEDITKKVFPETEDPTKMGMFKVLLAAFSGGATPKLNYQLASEAFAHYLKTGEIPATSDFRISETGAKRQLGRQAGMTAEKLSGMISSLGGEKKFIEYLTSKHDETIMGNKDAYGALDLGPKFGRFFLNLMGNENEVTVDLWATRTWNRWMGTPFRKVGGESKLPDVPTDAERNLVIQAFQGIAHEISKDYGKPMDAMDVQAVLWFFEKDLFAARGVKVDRGTFSEGAKSYAQNPIHKRTAPVVTGLKKPLQSDENQLSLTSK